MSDPWTFPRNKLFEVALARYDKDAPDYWQNVARAVGGGMTAEDVRRQYQELERDLNHIETTGSTPQNGGSSGGNSRGESSRGSSNREAQRQGRL